MRPYLAIIKDSFREALASYLLWILLVLCTLPLLLIAPLSLQEEESVMVSRRDVIDVQGFLEKMLAQAQLDTPSPGKQIWDSLSNEYRQALTEVAKVTREEDLDAMKVSAIIDGLPHQINAILADPYFYREEAFKDVEFGDETRKLLDKGFANLTSEKTKRLNRLLLHDAFPREIAAARQTDYILKYFKWQLMKQESFDKEKSLNSVLATFINFVIGFLAVGLAVIFTSSFVPRTFEGGAVDLLLSKPASRPLVFLAKFVGGLSFILVCASYFIGGLWLIVGIRFSFWDWRLLWSVPILLFLFAVYYAVSALAGVLWRSAIVSVVITVAFWMACFGVEKIKKILEAVTLGPNGITHVLVADRSILSVNEQGQVKQWFAEPGRWDLVFDNPEYGPPPMAMFAGYSKLVGPVYDSHQRRLLAMYAYDKRLLVGTPEDRWSQRLDLLLPNGANRLLLAPDGTLYVISLSGIYRETASVPPATESEASALMNPPPEKPGGRGFVMAGPQLRFVNLVESAMNPVTGDLVLYDQAKLVRLGQEENKNYRVVSEIDVQKLGPGILGYGEQMILLILNDGKIRIYDQDLKLVKEVSTAAGEPVRRISISADGKQAALLLHNGELWLCDPAAKALTKPAVKGQGKINAADFSGDSLFVVHEYTRVLEYDRHSLKQVNRMDGQLTPPQKVYYWAVKPFYTVFPKPGETEDLVHYLLTKQETAGVSEDLTRARAKLNIWQPFWSNLIFIVVLLSLGCVYVQRKDF